jgi:hypothetical protein
MKQEHKGRVLRVKTGYNPNSSSVGSLIPTFLALSASAAAMAVLAMNGLNTIDKHIRKKKKSLNSEGEK